MLKQKQNNTFFYTIFEHLYFYVGPYIDFLFLIFTYYDYFYL